MAGDRPSVRQWIGATAAVVLLMILIWIVLERRFGFGGIAQPVAALGAILFVILGIIGQTLTWYFALRATGSSVSFRAAFLTHSVTIWAKYIPGKVWSISGRAAALSHMNEESMSRSLTASSVAQIIMIAIALALASGNLKSILAREAENGISSVVFMLIGAGFAMICAAIYMKKRYDLGLNHLSQFFVSASMALLTWSLWGLALLQVLVSVGVQLTPLEAIAIFSASSVAGILAVFAPGGLGVRESVLLALLVGHGIALGDAAIISIIARICFTAGEAGIFLFATFAYRMRNI